MYLVPDLVLEISTSFIICYPPGGVNPAGGVNPSGGVKPPLGIVGVVEVVWVGCKTLLDVEVGVVVVEVVDATSGIMTTSPSERPSVTSVFE